MAKSRIVCFLSFALVIVIMLSCTTKSEPTLSQPTTSISATPKEPDWKEKWENVVAEGKKDGVIIGSSWASDVRVALSKAFQEKYGTEATFLAATADELFTKIQTERRAGLYIEDAGSMGAGSSIMFKRIGITEPMRPALILPEVLDEKAWLGGGLYFLDKEETVLGFVIKHYTTILINTELVGTNEIVSYKNLLEPKWKGKILWMDPGMSGGGNSFGAGIMAIMGNDFLTELAKQNIVLTKDKRLSVEWVARGKYPISLGADPTNMSDFINAGAPIKHIIPAEGTISGAGAGTIFLLGRSPHPSGIKLFINWFLSREGQTTFVKVSQDQSRRLDVTTEFVDPDRRIQPGVKYIDGETEEMYQLRDELKIIAPKIFGH